MMTAAAVEKRQSEQPVVVFDGVCNACSAWGLFVLRRDPEQRFVFAGMQGKTGRRLLADAGLDPANPVSFLLFEEGRYYQNTDALIHILKKLKRPWPRAGAVFALVPGTLRNRGYFLLARNRYRWFGRKESCAVPKSALRSRFLD